MSNQESPRFMNTTEDDDLDTDSIAGISDQADAIDSEDLEEDNSIQDQPTLLVRQKTNLPESP